MSKNQSNLRRASVALLASSLLLAACGDNDPATDASVSTVVVESAVESNYVGDYTLSNAEFGTEVTVTVDGTSRVIVTNALPDHETGEFPTQGNPNTISAQDITYEYTTTPTFVGTATGVRTTGVAVNGVKFEPGTAETVTCETGGTLRVEALQDIYNLGLDFNNAHVQPTGEYHYHGISEILATAYETDEDLVHIGFAADGYLIYYSKSGAYESGYELVAEPRIGTGCVGSQALRVDTVEIEGTTPDGTYSSDYVWSAAAGDLDSCNGAEIDGTYAYLITDSYPFISRCLNGEVTEAGPGGGAGPGGVGGPEGAPAGDGEGGAAPGNGAGPDLTEAAAALGVTVDELAAALGGPPPDLEAAAAALGVSVEELRAVMPAPPGGQQP